MVDHVPEFLRGEKTGEEILFSPSRLPLWFDYFSNENLLYQINNRLGAEAVARALPRRPATSWSSAAGPDRPRSHSASGSRGTRRCHGSRATTSRRSCPRSCARAERNLRRALSRRGVLRSREWTWTGISAEQGIAPAGATSSTRSTPCTSRATSTRRCGGSGTLCARRSGGVLRVRAAVPGQPIYVEFVFNFLENFTGVATDPATRPNHGFLTPANWRTRSPPPASRTRRSCPTSSRSRVTTTRSSWRR